MELLAFFFFFFSCIFKFFPPKNINSIYGYRTPRSMKNQDTWNVANKFSSNLMFGFSVLFIILMFFSYYLFFDKLLIIFLLIGLVTMIILTEFRLTQLFDKDGKRKVILNS
jgi:uncharacterized membrane protein